VRWCLREKGVVLAGPDPRELIDPVSAEALRAEVRGTMDRCLAVDHQPMDLVVWQVFWVGLYCRMLHTLETGTVQSKKAGSTWAAATLAPAWRELILRAQAVRDGDQRGFRNPADPDEVAAARAFFDYAAAYAAERGG